MTLREIIDHIPALGQLMEQMQIMSAPGRRALYDSKWLIDTVAIESEMDANAILLHLYESDSEHLTKIQHALMELKEIRGTIKRLSNGETLDDIELFELKKAALICVKLRSLITEAGVDCVEIPDLTSVVQLLDPQNTRVPHFYIYDSYSPELAETRARIKALDSSDSVPDGERERLYCLSLELEDQVRCQLSATLYPLCNDIQKAVDAAARLDLIQARAGLAHSLGCCRPAIVATACSSFRMLFNPVVRTILRSRGKDFQPVSISLVEGPTIVTGANMAGKSVLLKSVALAQALAQLGFFTPAEEAVVAPVDEILICIGDEQSEYSGLSSFASEMLRIDAILQRLRNGIKALVLIDEPARTTNPHEGKALVDALLRVLAQFSSSSLIATHYSGLSARCRRLRVKGFIEENCSATINVADINSFIDYSLVEESDDTVPHEALRIARLLGIDSDLLDCAQQIISLPEQL